MYSPVQGKKQNKTSTSCLLNSNLFLTGKIKNFKNWFSAPWELLDTKRRENQEHLSLFLLWKGWLITRVTKYERPNKVLWKEGGYIYSVDIYYYVKVKGQPVSHLLKLLSCKIGKTGRWAKDQLKFLLLLLWSQSSSIYYLRGTEFKTSPFKESISSVL